MILKIDSICIRRNKKILFDNLSLNLKKSQILFLKGSNGIGKTSLLDAISGLLNPEKGEIYITDYLSRNKKKLDKRSFFYLGHDFCLKDNLTVIENLIIWAKLCGKSATKKNIIQKLKYFKINNLINIPIYKLSQGQKRKVSLCKLLFDSRKIWILDEPTSGLDVSSTQNFLKLLRSHVRKEGSVIITSHIDLNIKPTHTIDLNKQKVKIKSQLNFNTWNHL